MEENTIRRLLEEKQLTDAQKAAVLHQKGAALVLAGPGSGKTTVIVTRIALLTDYLGSAERLLSVTFSRAAGKEMALRYAAGYPALPMPSFRTVHSLCNTIIREYEERTNRYYRRLEDVQQKAILREICRKVNGMEADTELLSRLAGWISRFANRWDSSLPLYFEPQIKQFPDLYEAYQNNKKEQFLLDFDDMIFLGRRLLQEENWLRRQWNRRYEYIQVDEGQDLSHAQFDVLRLLSESGNLFVVADDDQGIYGFRGADPSCVLQFETFYPGCRKYYLEENHRSCANVVGLASQVVSLNRTRYEKKLFTRKEPGPKVRFRSFPDGERQALFVSRAAAGREGRSIGMLYRNNLSGMLLALALRLCRLSYRMLSQPADPFSFWMVRELLQRMRLREEQPGRFVPSPYRVFTDLLGEGFFRSCLTFCETTGQQKRYAFCLLEFLSLLCRSCATREECVCLLQDLRNVGEGLETISLSTVHSAKGLEFDCVFVVDLLQDEFPGNGSSSGELLEEERRLFYVALTRAKTELFLLYPRRRGGRKEEASIFFEEAWNGGHKSRSGNNCQEPGNKVR